MSAVPTDDAVARRRLVEALRSGVPNRDAVALLGGGQPQLEDRLSELLTATTGLSAAGRHPGGLLLSGGFGSGKSHALEHLGQVAAAQGFVVSRVVVSKETPLHDLGRVLRAAVDSARAPGGSRPAVEEAAEALDPGSPAYAELLRWAVAPSTELDERFASTLLLLGRLRSQGGDQELVDLVVRFWSGDPLRVADLRRAMRTVGERPGSYPAVPARELAQQRLRFVARLLVAAGHEGWVLLLDEVELVGRYSLLQRGRSYAEVARWLLGRHDDLSLPVLAVLAVTDDFAAAVIDEKGDREQLPAKMRAKQSGEWSSLAADAELGMRALERDAVPLRRPSAQELDETYALIRQLHAEVFDWAPPDVPGLERLSTTNMRQHVRAWVNEWDLVRLDPDYRPVTEVVTVGSDYREDTALETDPNES